MSSQPSSRPTSNGASAPPRVSSLSSSQSVRSSLRNSTTAETVWFDWNHIEIPIEYKLELQEPYTPWFTVALICVCGICLLWEFSEYRWNLENIHVNPMLGPSVDVLISSGAKRGDLIVNDNEWWRLVSPIFLHSGIIHFMIAVIGLTTTCWEMEREFGPIKIMLIFLLGGIFGNITSAIFVPSQVGVGATGGILAVYGAEWGAIVQNKNMYGVAILKNTLSFILFSLMVFIFGLLPLLDNWSHLGGIIIGMFLGLCILVKPDPNLTVPQVKRQKFIAAISGFFVVSAFAVTLGVLATVITGTWCGDTCNNMDCKEWPTTGENKWWYCSQCRQYGFDYFLRTDGTGYLICPDQSEVKFTGQQGAGYNEMVQICDANCQDFGFDLNPSNKIVIS